VSCEQTYALRGILHATGIPGAVVEIPNRYWPEGPDYDDVRKPWLRVFTPRGVIVLGWRKRVISIDWSDSALDRDGADVVAKPEVTHDNAMCHAWGYDQAVECLRRLWQGSST